MKNAKNRGKYHASTEKLRQSARGKPWPPILANQRATDQGEKRAI
ncbi:MAG: hypothetical protein VB137_01330 [Burkholderia sp.]